MQIASDIFDIWSKPVSPDLRNGTITLPIAYTFLALPEPERETFQQKLQAKCADVEHHKTLRQMMGKTNAFLYSLTKAETYRQKALMSLSQLEKQGLHNPYLTYFAKVTALCSA